MAEWNKEAIAPSMLYYKTKKIMTSLQERLFDMQDKQYAAFSKKKKERSILATDLGLSLICLLI